MRRSIRWRLQAWYALVLLSVVSGFAGLLYFQVRSSRFREIDAELQAGAQYLDAILRRGPPPPPERIPRPPEPPGVRRGTDMPGLPPLPPPPSGLPPENWEHLRAELELPRRPEQPGPNPPWERPFFAVWDENGELVKGRNLPKQPGLDLRTATPFSPQPRLLQRGEFREVVMSGPRQTRILVGRSVRRQQDELRTFAWQLAGAGGLVLAIGLTGGWFVSARILRPVATIAATASAISAANLSGRINLQTLDLELLSLGKVLNAMFDRLEAAFERQARFTADASHELRTPLAILRSHAELSLNRPRSVEEYKEALETSLRAATRMTGLVEGLLTLARADAGKLDLEHKVFDWQTVVQESIELVRPLAESKNVTLTADLESATVMGDPMRLGQVATNLLTNAIQYNRPGGEVHVDLSTSTEGVKLSVRDTGCGIADEDRPHLFERFYRADKARSRASGGNGLGLAICQSIIASHGGTMGFESTCAEGSTFWVRMKKAEIG